MKRAALRYAEILEKGAWVTHQEQAEIAKLLRSLVMTEDQAWDELEARLNRKKAIKQIEQEPVAAVELITIGSEQTIAVAWHDSNAFKLGVKLYTTPPSKPWVSLTDKEIAETIGSPIDEIYLKDFRKVEAKLKDKNNKPEKKWVGLENIDFQYQPPAEVITMKYAEAILKEKNT